ncbi:MAG: hypothetical protein ACRDZY_18805, partial [Acidimicrobiales bacterium]
PKALVGSNNDTISGNHTTANYAGCGIVVAVQNPGATLTGITITGNVVTGTKTFGPTGPDVGGIVVAADSPGTGIIGATVAHNTVTDGAEAGIIVHAEAPHAHTVQVSVTGNTVSGNNWAFATGPTATTGVIVSAGPAPAPINAFNKDTVVTGNTITGQHYGIWSEGAYPPTISGNKITVTPGGSAVDIVPRPGSGYTEVAADGGVFTFGAAQFHGSLGGTDQASPVVGMSESQDQGGYWLASADGAVHNFGDAQPYGSMSGKPLAAPLVGIASTSYVAGNGGQASPAGQGYWEVAADGGVFSFGDAHYYGSMGGKPLVAKVVGLVPTPDGHGYWEVAADGGVFSFGDAHYYGSMGGKPLV